MSSVNRVTLVGNVGQEPELKTSQSGITYVSLSLATSERWKDKTGNLQEKTTWHNLKFYDTLANVVANYVRKGSKIYVEGSIRNGEYDKDGLKKRFTEILCKQLVLLDKPASKEAPQQEQRKSRQLDPAIDQEIQNLKTKAGFNSGVFYDPTLNPLRNKQIQENGFPDLDDDIPF
jgi:single-strand DNA-binding protein